MISIFDLTRFYHSSYTAPTRDVIRPYIVYAHPTVKEVSPFWQVSPRTDGQTTSYRHDRDADAGHGRISDKAQACEVRDAVVAEVLGGVITNDPWVL